MTFHKKQYSWWEENPSKNTINMGLAAAVQYNFNKNFFMSAGAGFISRNLPTANFLNQAALPPPKRSFTLELVTTKTITYRILSFPMGIGYNVISKENVKAFLNTGFAGNFLVNTQYRSNFSRYDGTYKKNFWQGYSLTAGAGFDYKIADKMFATTSLSYSFINTVRKDEYLSSQNGTGLASKHTFLSLNMGLKVSL